jgi:hypothetical protein
VFWVISVYFNIRNTLPKSGPFLLLHPVYIYIYKRRSDKIYLIIKVREFSSSNQRAKSSAVSTAVVASGLRL